MHRAIRSIAAFSVLLASDAEATKFRRPYDEAISLGYGVDYDGGRSGCTAYDCGGRCYNGHGGNDYPLPRGTAVRAAAKGTVTYVSQGCPDTGYYCSQCGGGFGNYVRVRHADGRDTYYAHMKNGSMVVTTGQAVSCGQKLGESASSGCSTGNHLHFDLRSGSTRLDPYSGSCAAGASDWVDQRSGMPTTQCEVTCQCTPGATRSERCGDCGRRTMTCRSDCQWGNWGACGGEGECAAGASQTRACGDCGTQSRQCDAQCHWGSFDGCGGPDPDGGQRACDAGGLGPCAEGRVRCREGNHVCEALFTPVDEICDSVDNDCDGTVDDGKPQILGDPPPAWSAELLDASWPRTLESGAVGTVWVDFRNTGSEPWVGGRVWLEVQSSDAPAVSPLQDEDSWEAWDVPAVVWDEVGPGEVTRLEFSIVASSPGTETFRLRSPDGEAMACPQPEFDVEVSVEARPEPTAPEAPQPDPSTAPAPPPVRVNATGAPACGVVRTSGQSPLGWALLFMVVIFGRRRLGRRSLGLLALLAAAGCHGDATVQYPEPTDPVVDAVEPGEFSARGRTEIVLHGRNLDQIAAVAFDGYPASVVSVSDEELRILTPRMIAGQPELLLGVEGDDAPVVRLRGLFEVTPVEVHFAPADFPPYAVSEGGVARAAVAADIDGDGDEDLLIGGDTPEVGALLVNEAGLLRNASALDPNRVPFPPLVRSIVAADLDGDGDIDLLFTTEKDQLPVLLINDGFGRFTQGPELPPDLAPATRARAADFDGDGLTDLAFIDRAEGEPSLHVLMNRTQTAGPPTFIVTPAEMFAQGGTLSTDVLPFDVDGDEDLDLMIVHGNPEHGAGRPYTVLRNGGLGTFTTDLAALPPFADGSGVRGAVLDCDRDDDWDIFLAGPGQDHLLQNELSTFVDITTTALPVDDSPVGDVVARDLNLDGIADLVVANVGAQNRLYMSRWDARLRDETPRLPIARDDTVAVVVADFDANGGDDLFFLHRSGEPTLLYSSDGTEPAPRPEDLEAGSTPDAGWPDAGGDGP